MLEDQRPAVERNVQVSGLWTQELRANPYLINNSHLPSVCGLYGLVNVGVKSPNSA